MATIKSLSNTDCPSLSLLYARVKQTYNFTTLDASVVSEFGGLAG